MSKIFEEILTCRTPYRKDPVLIHTDRCYEQRKIAPSRFCTLPQILPSTIALDFCRNCSFQSQKKYIVRLVHLRGKGANGRCETYSFVWKSCDDMFYPSIQYRNLKRISVMVGCRTWPGLEFYYLADVLDKTSIVLHWDAYYAFLALERYSTKSTRFPIAQWVVMLIV